MMTPFPFRPARVGAPASWSTACAARFLNLGAFGVLGLLGILLAGCGREAPQGSALQGYVEGEYAQIAVPAAGQLARLQVRRGDQVEAGKPLFALESVNEQAARREAQERLHASQERLANLRGARRPLEQQSAQAQAEQAVAARRLSTEQLRQQERLFKSGFISQAALDQARASFERDQARVTEVEAQQKLAAQPVGRDAEVRAATADVETARALLAQSEWRLGQRAVAAPVTALVHDTYFVEGEWVPANRPVVSLLAPGNVKVRFFVSEALLGGIRTGDSVQITCDGCGAPIAAAVSYISRQAEYTPPVLYSKDSRAKLVFMIEARPAQAADAARLHPGQPVDVRLAGGKPAGP